MGEVQAQVTAVDNMKGTFRLGDTKVDGMLQLRRVLNNKGDGVRIELNWHGIDHNSKLQ